MGIYIDPENMSKEQWLEKNGSFPLAYPYDLNHEALVEGGYLPVCLVDNGLFTAAGICYNENEFRDFMEPDGRPKRWYVVSVDKLLEVCPKLINYLKK